MSEAHLEPRLVGDIFGRFYVPAYQRGYRWGEVEVRRLLDDIWEADGAPYYLQPIVVKAYGDEWELVDGQQRLTTLNLILEYMRREGLQSTGATYSLRYETREDSANYLRDLDPERKDENIDFFHMSEAYRCIAEWFDSRGNRRQFAANELYGALFKSVQVIWYEADEEVDAPTLFTRLNVGRIPLTDAELVKALLLSKLRMLPGHSDRSVETAVEWDSIERDLRDPELWAFITGRSDETPTHISLLLDTIAGGPTGRERPLFHTFESLREQIAVDPEGFWRKVVDLHSLIVGWHDNRDLFHKIGFLVAERRVTLADLMVLAEGKAKSRFESELDEQIRQWVNLSEGDLRDLTYGSVKTGRVLLLMNVETIRQRTNSSERYSFREHASGRWSLEHIHAQNAEELPRRAEVWERWLKDHRRALMAVEELFSDEKDDLLAHVDRVLAVPPVKGTDFDSLQQQLTAMLSASDDSSTVDVDSIANLALLDGGDNSALSNSVFAVKRAEILRRDRVGAYIPVCTRNAFLKYYSTDEDQQAHFWSSSDRDAYVGAVVDAVADYLIGEGETS
nr:DUF262 domain-containing protein [Aeromicrobium duanguangcaii]